MAFTSSSTFRRWARAALGLLCRTFKPVLSLPEFPDAGLEVIHLHVGGLHQVVEPAQPLAHVAKLRVDGLQPLALLPGHAAHLRLHHLHQVVDAVLGEDVGANPVDHQLLEAAGVECGSLTGVLTDLDVGRADVVGVLAALGEPAGEGRLARLALGQAAEQVGASRPCGDG